MFIARVVGRIWATMKNVAYQGMPLLIVQPLDESLEESGAPEIAVDALGMGEGEIVWVEGGKEASYALFSKYGPSDSSIVAKIDSLDLPVKAPAGVRVRLPGEAAS
jgi:ethanolamine utilization protein EutN